MLEFRQRQAQTAAQLREREVFERLGRHPHLAQLLAFSKRPCGTELWIMEFAPNGSLDHVLQELELKGQAFPTNQVLITVASQVR